MQPMLAELALVLESVKCPIRARLLWQHQKLGLAIRFAKSKSENQQNKANIFMRFKRMSITERWKVPLSNK